MTNYNERLDEIFAPLIDSPSLTLTTAYWDEAKQAILSDLLEIIGEDEKQPHPVNDESRCRFYRVGGKNFVRQELREKVKKYCE